MSSAEPTPDPAVRVTSVAAVLFAISFFWTVASVNVPHTASDAELMDWWQHDANVTSGMVSMLFAVLSALLFTVVANYLVSLLGSRSPLLTGFARSMATAFTATLLVSAALRGVIGHLVKVLDEPLPDVDVLRYTTALNYTVLGVVVMGSFALFVLAVAVVVLRTGGLPRWIGLVSLGCGVLTLGAVAALQGVFTVPLAILWALCTAVAVWRVPAPGAGGTPIVEVEEAPQAR